MSNGTLTDAQLSGILGEGLYNELQPYMAGGPPGTGSGVQGGFFGKTL
jgi:hypothetical protein